VSPPRIQPSLPLRSIVSSLCLVLHFCRSEICWLGIIVSQKLAQPSTSNLQTLVLVPWRGSYMLPSILVTTWHDAMAHICLLHACAQTCWLAIIALKQQKYREGIKGLMGVPTWNAIFVSSFERSGLHSPSSHL
jgi:hypothetical protein